MKYLLLAFSVKVIALIIGLVRFRFLSKPYKLFLLQIFVAIIVESYGRYLVVKIHAPNLWLFNIYMIIEFLLISSAGILLNRKYKDFFISMVVCGIAVWSIEIFRQGIFVLANWFYLSASFLIVLIYLGILLQSRTIFNSNKIASQPLFWLCLSTLIFFCCYLPYKGLENIILTEYPTIAKDMFKINLGLNVIRYPLIGLSFYLLGYQSQKN